MMMTYIHDANGRILCQTNAPPDEAANLLRPGGGLVESEGGESSSSHYVSEGALVPFPASPGDAYEWDWASHTYRLTEAAAAALRISKKKEVERIAAVLAEASVTYAGNLFDADAAAILNITGVVSRIARGDGLPAGWLGWRTADNQMVWSDLGAEAVLAQLRAISVLMEDRRQSILVAKWAHKDAIDAIDAAAPLDIQAYDVTAGWPS